MKRKHQQATIQFYPGQLEAMKKIVASHREPNVSEVVRKAVAMYLSAQVQND